MVGELKINVNVLEEVSTTDGHSLLLSYCSKCGDKDWLLLEEVYGDERPRVQQLWHHLILYCQYGRSNQHSKLRYVKCPGRLAAITNKDYARRCDARLDEHC